MLIRKSLIKLDILKLHLGQVTNHDQKHGKVGLQGRYMNVPEQRKFFKKSYTPIIMLIATDQ